MQKFMLLYSFALFHFGFEDNFRVQAPGVGLGGAICRFFCVTSLGGLYMERLFSGFYGIF